MSMIWAFVLRNHKWMLVGAFVAAALIGIKFWERRLIEQGRNEQIAIYTTKALAAEKAAQLKQAELQTKASEAINAAHQQIQKKQIALDSVNRSNDRLRDQLAASRSQLPDASSASLREYASTLTAVFGECAAEYRDMADKATSHAIDSMMYQQAWPK